MDVVVHGFENLGVFDLGRLYHAERSGATGEPQVMTEPPCRAADDRKLGVGGVRFSA
jgi:hypothetical protein